MRMLLAILGVVGLAAAVVCGIGLPDLYREVEVLHPGNFTTWLLFSIVALGFCGVASAIHGVRRAVEHSGAMGRYAPATPPGQYPVQAQPAPRPQPGPRR